MKTIALALAMLAQMAAPAAPATHEFCATISALAAGAAEATPFQTLRGASPQFRLDRLACFGAASGYTCSHNLARANETRESYATRIAACLPGATRTTESRNYSTYIVIRSGRLQARIAEDGLDRGHVGRSIRVYFAASAT